MQVSLKSVLINWSALVALWAPPYLAVLDHCYPRSAANSEPLQWLLVIIGFFGIGSVLYISWKDTRDPAWRAAHWLTRQDAELYDRKKLFRSGR
jgi:hypothetical protein